MNQDPRTTRLLSAARAALHALERLTFEKCGSMSDGAPEYNELGATVAVMAELSLAIEAFDAEASPYFLYHEAELAKVQAEIFMRDTPQDEPRVLLRRELAAYLRRIAEWFCTPTPGEPLLDVEHSDGTWVTV